MIVDYDVPKGIMDIGDFVVPKSGIWLFDVKSSSKQEVFPWIVVDGNKFHDIIRKIEQGTKVKIILENTGETIHKNNIKVEFNAVELF